MNILGPLFGALLMQLAGYSRERWVEEGDDPLPERIQPVIELLQFALVRSSPSRLLPSGVSSLPSSLAAPQVLRASAGAC